MHKQLRLKFAESTETEKAFDHVTRLVDGTVSDGFLCDEPPRCNLCAELCQSDVSEFIEKIGGITYLEERARRATEYARGRGGNHLAEITVKMIVDMFVNQWASCLVCTMPFNERGDAESTFQIDHKYPVSRGGSNASHNLQLLCVHCNRSKGVLLPRELTQVFRLPADLCPSCGGRKDIDFQLCPRCQDPDRYESDLCRECGSDKTPGYKLCRECHDEYR